METSKFNRRNWLKKGMLVAGGVMAVPHLGFSKTSYSLPKLDVKGNLVYSPLFKEYLPENFTANPSLKAKLNANENPYGPSPKALEAFKASAHLGNRYGFRDMAGLVGKIAHKNKVVAQNIVMGPGSTDLLEKTAMVFCANGGNVISPDTTFMSLIRTARAMGANWKPVPLKKDWSHDLDAMEAAIDSNTKLMYVCNPNNPTGTLTDHNALLDFCSRVSEKIPVFVDEAYLDFLDEGGKKSMVSLVKEGKDVIIARTFSKIYGMAGLRVGYAIGQEATIGKIKELSVAGLGITYPSIKAAEAAMDDVEFIEKSKTLNAECREYVYQSLETMGIPYVPSHTSFMIFPITMQGKAFLQKMTEHQVGVRAFEINGKDWCRVSMGTLQEMEIFVDALKKVMV